MKMADDGTSNFDMGDMKESIAGPGRDVTYEGRPKELEEAQKRAREHGYKPRVEYNYQEKGDSRRVAKFARCDWSATGDMGKIAPRIPELEADLFSDEKTYGKGMHIDVLENVKIDVTGDDIPKSHDTVSRLDRLFMP